METGGLVMKFFEENPTNPTVVMRCRGEVNMVETKIEHPRQHSLDLSANRVYSARCIAVFHRILDRKHRRVGYQYEPAIRGRHLIC